MTELAGLLHRAGDGGPAPAPPPGLVTVAAGHGLTAFATAGDEPTIVDAGGALGLVAAPGAAGAPDAAGVEELVRRLARDPGRPGEVPPGERSLVVHDRAAGRLVGLVDRFRCRPLYLAPGRRGVVFATRLSLLRHLAGEPPELDGGAFAHYLAAGVLLAPSSPYRGVVAVPGASWFATGETGDGGDGDDGGPAVRWGGYWEPEPAEDGPELTPQQLRRELAAAVARTLERAGGEVGLLLSSGVDSSSLAHLAAAAVGAGRLVALTVGFDRFVERDEVEPARRLAAELGLRHHVASVTAADFWRAVPEIARALDQPTFDGIDSYFALSLAGRAGVPVAVAGHGGDELFGGYPTYRLAGWDGGTPVAPGPHALAFARAKLTEDLAFPGDLAAGPPSAAGPRVRAAVAAGAAGVAARLAECCAGLRGAAAVPFRATRRLERKVSLEDRQMRDCAALIGRCGPPLLCPLLDPVLWQRVAAVPPTRLTPDATAKGLFRAAVEPLLPPAVLGLPKRGFEPPLFVWLVRTAPELVDFVLAGGAAAEAGLVDPAAVAALRGELAALPDDHPQANSRAYKLWLLLALELWLRLDHHDDRSWGEELADRIERRFG